MVRFSLEGLDSGTGCRFDFPGLSAPEFSGPAVARAYWDALLLTGWESPQDGPPAVLSWVVDVDGVAGFIFRDAEPDACFGRVLIAGFARPE